MSFSLQNVRNSSQKPDNHLLPRSNPSSSTFLTPSVRSLCLFLMIGVFTGIGCNTSSVVVGNTRPATNPEVIKVYLTPPKEYEAIGIVSSDSNLSLRFGAQGKVNAALARAKKEAARLGANGLLLQTLGESGSVAVGTGTTSGTSTTVVGVGGGGLIKTVSAIAILVQEE